MNVTVYSKGDLSPDELEGVTDWDYDSNAVAVFFVVPGETRYYPIHALQGWIVSE
jgi:hypothetical protein